MIVSYLLSNLLPIHLKTVNLFVSALSRRKRNHQLRMNCFTGGTDPNLSEEDLAALREQKQNSKNIDSQLKKERKEYRATHRLLLLGTIQMAVRISLITNTPSL